MQLGTIAIMPELMLVITALVLLLIDPALPPGGRRGLSWLGIFACVTAAISTYMTRHEQFTVFNHGIAVDKYAFFFKLLFLAIAVITMLFSEKYLALKDRLLGDYFALILLATVGMMVMAEAIDLMTFYVGLELMAFSSYLLSGFLRYNLRSVEAALKYFVTGVFASTFMLFGIALLYGISGSTNFDQISNAVRLNGVNDAPLVAAVILILGGFAFKIAAVPFHNWAPDVYQGAPTPVTAFLSVGPKAAGFAALIKFFTLILEDQPAIWTPLMIAVAIATMLTGATLALVQRDLKRMLAYSSIAHAGYLLLAVIAAGEGASSFGSASVLFYLAAYAFMNLGAFGILAYLANSSRFGDSLDDIAGLGRHFPWAAGVMTLFMFSLAGIPPTAGFFAKFYLFAAVVDAGLVWLAVVGVLFSLVSAYYYLRVIVYMYMREPEAAPEKTGERSPDLSIGIALAAAGVVLLGILPSFVLEAARNAVTMMLGY